MLIYNKYDKKKLLAVIVLVNFRLIDESMNNRSTFYNSLKMLSRLFLVWQKVVVLPIDHNKLVLSDTE